MSRGGRRGVEYALGTPQTRVCGCEPPAVLENSNGRCVKCGHQRERDTAADLARGVAWAFAEILNRD